MKSIRSARVWAILAAVLFWTAGAVAQERVVVVAGRLLDVKSGKTLTNQAIVIENERVVSVGPAAEASLPAGVRRIDLPDLTVLPGLIDVHTHLTSDPSFGYESLGISIPRQTLIGAKNARVTLLAGFTTVRNVGAHAFTDVALRDAINAGDIPGPRLEVSGPLLSITGGHCDQNLLPWEYHVTADGVADGVDAVQHKVRENIKYGADLIKVCATGGVLSKGDNPMHAQYTLEELKMIVSEAHRLGRKVAAHAHGAEGILWATEAGVDSIEHGSYIDDAGIAAMKQHGTYLVPTQFLGDWMKENADKIHLSDMYRQKMVDTTAASRKNVARAMAAGVKIALGTDAAVYPHGLNAGEFAVYVKMGMTPLAAIQAGTVNAADLMGWSDRVGSLEPGHYADLIAVAGDPLHDITTLQHVVFVMKGGRVVKDETRP